LKIGLVLAVVFVLGFATGMALNGLYGSLTKAVRAGAREAIARERFEKIRRELQLTEDQTKAVREVLDETRNEYRTLSNELRPRFEEPRQKARSRIRSLLRPEQQTKFDELVVRDQDRSSRSATR
jgi:septal ring factor EnvC (AmiA/AmiB activator)